MRFLSSCIVLSLLTALPLALGAPADTPATTTLLPATPTLSSRFPHQTPYDGAYPDAHRCGDDGRDEPWKVAPLESEPRGAVTEFVPEPTGLDGKVVQRWYIVTYWSCVTFSNDYVHCGYHTPVRPGVGPDGCFFDDGGRKEVWIAGVVVAVVGAIVM